MLRQPVYRMSGALMLAFALVGGHVARADGKKMVLTRPLKAGAVTTYKATIKANLQGMDIVIEQSQKQTIKSIKDDGTMAILSEDLGGTMKVNGAVQESKPGPPTTETRDKLGKLIEYTHEQSGQEPFSPEVQRLISSVGELLMTDKEVAEGDSWDTELDNPAFKDKKVKVKTTYQGIEKVGDVDLWKFKQTAEAVVNADGAKMVNESIIWLNPKDGLMEKLDGKVKDVPSQLGPLAFAIAISRVKAAPADTKVQ